MSIPSMLGDRIRSVRWSDIGTLALVSCSCFVIGLQLSGRSHMRVDRASSPLRFHQVLVPPNTAAGSWTYLVADSTAACGDVMQVAPLLPADVRLVAVDPMQESVTCWTAPASGSDEVDREAMRSATEVMRYAGARFALIDRLGRVVYSSRSHVTAPLRDLLLDYRASASGPGS